MRVLVTGATGFLGSHVTRALVARGADVTALVRRGSDPWRVADVLPRLELVSADLAESEASARALQDAAAEVVCDLAWHGVGNRFHQDPSQVSANLQAHLDLLATAARAGCRRWIGLGTQAEYGPQSARIDERCPPAPTTLYGAVKLSVGLLGRQLAAQAGMEFVWLRLFSSYGPMDEPGWLIPSVTLRLLGRERPDLTAGTQKWDYLLVEDAAGAVVEAATAPTAGGGLHLGRGRLPHRALPLARRPPGRALRIRAAGRSAPARLARARPLHPQQGPRRRHLLRRARGTRLLPSRVARGVLPRWRPALWPRHLHRGAGRRGLDGFPRPRAVDRLRHGAGRQARAEPRPGLRGAERRRARRRIDVGGRAVRRPPPPGQPRRHGRLQQDTELRTRGRGARPRSPGGQVACLPVGRAGDRRPRPRDDRRRARIGAARGGAPERARRPHRQGQGRQLHGERSRVALQVARRTTARPRAGRARGGPMRGAFRDAICELAAADERIWLLTGDLGYTVLEPFYERFPARFVNVGVAEQNMTGVAAGLALSGKIVFTYSIANFPTLRCLEQVRNDVCYHNLNVNIVAVGGGVVYGPLGYTHHAVEDLAIMRTLPNITVAAPGDPVEVRLATRALAARTGPSYLRLGRATETVVHREEPGCEIGRPLVVRAVGDGVLAGIGGVLRHVAQAAERLAADGVAARVVSLHTLKPLDADTLVRAVAGPRHVFFVAEHVEAGGPGEIGASCLIDRK